jgi:hypothetical protein
VELLSGTLAFFFPLGHIFLVLVGSSILSLVGLRLEDVTFP